MAERPWNYGQVRRKERLGGRRDWEGGETGREERLGGRGQVRRKERLGGRGQSKRVIVLFLNLCQQCSLIPIKPY